MNDKNPLSIGVFGLGHVGLPTALGFSELGWNVIGVESDPKKAQLIKNGDVPFSEIGVADLLKKHSNSGKFSVTTDTKLAVKQADILFMCVGTPRRADGSADTSQLEQLARELRDSIASYKIVIQKSTAPVNTSRKIKDILFGGKKLPELARGLGLGLKEFKKATREIKDEVNSAAENVDDEQTSD